MSKNNTINIGNNEEFSIFIISELSNNLKDYLSDFKLKPKIIFEYELYKVKYADVVLIYGFETKSKIMIDTLKKTNFSAYFVQIYTKIYFANSVIDCGADDIFYGKDVNKQICLLRLKNWVEIAKHRKYLRKKLPNGKNAFGANVWLRKTTIVLANNSAIDLALDFLNDNKTLNEYGNKHIWIENVNKIFDILIQQFKVCPIAVAIFEENDEHFFMTVENISLDNREFYDYLAQSLKLDIKYFGFTYKKSVFSIFMKKLKTSHTNTKDIIRYYKNDILTNIMRKSLANKIDDAETYLEDIFFKHTDLEEIDLIEVEFADLIYYSMNIFEQLKLYSNFFLSYSKALAKFIEFDDLKIALEEVSKLLDTISQSEQELHEKALLFAGLLKEDLFLWKTHVFILKDAKNIHYLDANMLSNCSMIESLLIKQDKSEEEYELEWFI